MMGFYKRGMEEEHLVPLMLKYLPTPDLELQLWPCLELPRQAVHLTVDLLMGLDITVHLKILIVSLRLRLFLHFSAILAKLLICSLLSQTTHT